MAMADPRTYLADLCGELRRHWPENRLTHLACHGHSVPAGYFATPMVDSFNAYPHLLHRALKARFPFAVLNVVVTAIGGENSESGAARFVGDVLAFKPRVVTIDYALNDRGIGLETAGKSWRQMIEMAQARDARVLLLTPTPDRSMLPGVDVAAWDALQAHAEQIRALADEYAVGLADSLAAFQTRVAAGTDLNNLLSWSNHPGRAGHELVVNELARWFPA